MKYGDYIRTKTGKIRKIVDTVAQYYLIKEVTFDEKVNRNDIGYTAEDIIKHSKNIIDLIEIGDYVNGHKIVSEIWGEDDNNLYFEIEGGFNKATCIAEEDIKSILTKEQFNQNSYKVVE